MLRVSALTLLRHSSRSFSTTRGTIKFYNRKKAFGFIIADEDAGVDKDIFVHRSHIAGASDDHPMFLPYLLQEERVSFDIAEEDGNLVAQNVRWEDGKNIPVYRDQEMVNLNKRIKHQMGSKVYDILDDDTMSEQDKVSNIMEEFGKAKEEMADLEAKHKAEQEARGISEEEAL